MDYGSYCVLCGHVRSLLKKGKLESVNSSIVSKPSNHSRIWTIWAWITESQYIYVACFKDDKIMCTVLKENHKFDHFTNPSEVIEWIDKNVEAE